MSHWPTSALLPVEPDEVAPDRSLVRVLVGVPGAGMAHFTLAAGQVSVPQRHRTVSELWYVLDGRGRMWRRGPDGVEHTDELTAGLALGLPVGTAFQFRNDGDDPLTVVAATVPPWPGPDEAVAVDGPWPPS